MSNLFKNQNFENVLQCIICFRGYTEVDPCSFICGHSCCVACAKQLKKCHLCYESISYATKMKANYAMKDVLLSLRQMSEFISKVCNDVTIEEAAEKGVSFAQYEVGKKCLANDNVNEAISYFKLSADQGVVEAHYELWKLLSPTEAAERSSYSEELLSHLKCCADSGKWSECQYELAQYYEVVDKNMGEAVRYYKLSEDKNNVEAKYRMWQLVHQNIISNDSPSDQHARLEWLAARGKVDCQYELARYYSNNNRHNQSFKYFKLAADQGHAEAQYQVGSHYVVGCGVEESTSRALAYLTLAVHQGHAKAVHKVGEINEEEGSNLVEAFSCYRLAAEYGDIDAQCIVGEWYTEGKGVEIDLFQAFKYFVMAAIQGYKSCLNKVAHCYLDGRGTDVNKELAAHYFKLSADKGVTDSQYQLGRIYESDQSVVDNMQLAFKYYKMAADNRHSEACYIVGQWYANGQYVGRNDVEALRYYNRSAHPYAMFQVGLIYFNDSTKDTKLAFNSFFKSAKKGCKQAYYYVAICYEQGRGTVKNPEEAFKYFKLSADKCKNREARFKVGAHYWQDNKKVDTFRYFKLSADQGHVEATYLVGVCYLSGEGVTVNYEKALKYLNSQLRSDDIVNYRQCYDLFKLLPFNTDFTCSEYLLNCSNLDPRHMQVDGLYNVAMAFHAGYSELMADVEKKIAFKYFKLAVDKGHVNACLMLIDCYENELTKRRNIKYWMMAADHGHVRAQLKAGELLSSGNKADDVKASHYYKLAAMAGNVIVIDHLCKFKSRSSKSLK